MGTMRILPLMLLACCLVGAEVDKGKAINTICPVTGKPIDAKLAPVVVVIGKGEKARRYTIGIAVASAADTIKGDPQKYADAAKANKKAE